MPPASSAAGRPCDPQLAPLFCARRPLQTGVQAELVQASLADARQLEGEAGALRVRGGGCKPLAGALAGCAACALPAQRTQQGTHPLLPIPQAAAAKRDKAICAAICQRDAAARALNQRLHRRARRWAAGAPCRGELALPKRPSLGGLLTAHPLQAGRGGGRGGGQGCAGGGAAAAAGGGACCLGLLPGPASRCCCWGPGRMPTPFLAGPDTQDQSSLCRVLWHSAPVSPP